MTLAPDLDELADRLDQPPRFTCGVGHPESEQRYRGLLRECRACAREARRRRRRREAASAYGVIVLAAPRPVQEKAAALGIRRPLENLVEDSLRAGDIDGGGLIRLHTPGVLLAEVERDRSPLSRRPAWRIIALHTKGAPAP